MKKLLLSTVIATLLLFALAAENASAQTKVRVRFAKGASSANLKGKVAGYKYIDYVVRAKSGQTMTVSLKSANDSCGFVMFYSDLKNVEDATNVADFSRNVDVDDDYIVRVLLPRSAARRKESASYSLEIIIE